MSSSTLPRRLLAVALIVAGLSVGSLVALRDEFADRGATLAQILPPEEEEEEAEEEQGATGEATGRATQEQELVLVALGGAGSPWADERVETLERALAAVPGVARVDELVGQEGLLQDPTVRVLAAALGGGPRPIEEERRLARAFEEALAAARTEGERAYAIGWPRLRTDSWDLARADLLRLLPVLAVAALCIPPAFLGSSGSGLFALLVAAATTALTLWGYRLACGPLSPLALLVVPLVWAVATMDALHLAGRVRAHAARGSSPAHAWRRARAELWAPCLVTSLTSAAGFGVMGVIGRAALLQELGLASALGILGAYVLTFGPLAPLAALCARGRLPARWPTALGLALLRRARRAPERWIVAWAVLGLGALVALPGLRVATDFPRLFAPHVPLARDLEHLAGALGTDLNPLDVRLEATDEHGRRATALLGSVMALTHALHALPEVRAVLPVDACARVALDGLVPGPSPAEREAALAQLLGRAELAPWVDLSQGRARLQVHLAPASFERKAELLERLRHFDATMLGHHALSFAGTGYAVHRAEELGLADLRSGTLLSLLALVAVLALALRRARALAAMLVTGALPFLCVAGVMSVAHVPWSIAMLPLPSVLLGIAMDDGVHLLFRPRGRERFDALPAIFATTALVVASVATLAWTSFQTNRSLGLLLAFGLLVALAADLSLLPALVRGSRRRAPR